MIASVFFISLSFQSAFGYVYLAPQKPKIVPQDGLTQEFHLTSQAPVFSDKDLFEDGFYSEYSDDETFALLVQRSMNYWNSIDGLSLRLRVADERKGVIDPNDGLFSVGVAKITTVASGLAFPVVDENNLKLLRDCDIQVGTDIDSIPSFIFVMVHEFGHCLGLGHNHSDPSAIMGYWQPRSVIELGLDDIAGVLSLYPPAGDGELKTFAPCGSLVGVAARGAEGRPPQFQILRPQRSVLPAVILLIPVLGVALSSVTSWSFRRRRQLSDR